MKQIKQFFKNTVNPSYKQKNKRDKKKMYFSEIKTTTFKRRKKQLSLNINKFNYINLIIKNKYIIYLSILSLLIIWVIILFFSPFTKVQKINIIKKDDITNINIAYNSLDNIRWKSILNIDKSKIKSKLIQYQSNLKNINIDIKLPNSIKISLESYLPLFYTTFNIWELEKKYLILSNWTLIPSSKEITDLKLLNIITNDDSKLANFLDYKQIYSENYINNINIIINKLKENIIDINIEELTYYKIERELHIKTNNSILIFSLDENISNQIEKLVIFNKDYKNISKAWIYYIDIRVKDKIFYCPNEEEYTCIQNLKRIYLK